MSLPNSRRGAAYSRVLSFTCQTGPDIFTSSKPAIFIVPTLQVISDSTRVGASKETISFIDMNDWQIIFLGERNNRL